MSVQEFVIPGRLPGLNDYTAACRGRAIAGGKMKHRAQDAVREAIRAAGLEPIETPVRGGTDGATLSYMGLPCPNLGTGGFNYHGPCEGITVEAMDKATEILLNLADIYKDVQ